MAGSPRCVTSGRLSAEGEGDAAGLPMREPPERIYEPVTSEHGISGQSVRERESLVTPLGPRDARVATKE
jgi:hypothetical protein